MWIEGKNYKSVNFTHFEEKLMDGSKFQTCRTGFIASYKIGEVIATTFKDITKKRPKKKLLFLVPVEAYYPKQLKDFTLEEAKADGFDSIEAFQEGIMKINNIDDLDHWSFLTRWNPNKRIFFKNLTEWLKNDD